MRENPNRRLIKISGHGGNPVYRVATTYTAVAEVYAAPNRDAEGDGPSVRLEVRQDGSWQVIERPAGPYGYEVVTGSGKVGGEQLPAYGDTAQVHPQRPTVKEFTVLSCDPNADEVRPLAGRGTVTAENGEVHALSDVRVIARRPATRYQRLISREGVAEMDESTLEVLTGLISDELQSRATDTIARQVRACWDDDEDTAEWRDQARTVIFRSTEHDNGHWFDTSAIVLFADGTDEEYEFDSELDETLTELSHPARDVDGMDGYSVLRLDLATGETEHVKSYPRECGECHAMIPDYEDGIQRASMHGPLCSKLPGGSLVPGLPRPAAR